jgi:hypothetical protein
MITDNLRCFKYLHEHDLCPKNSTALCNFASFIGSLNCLQFAHENGYPWDKDVSMINALVMNNIDCLQYAHEHGGVFNQEISPKLKNYLRRIGGYPETFQS